MGTQHIPSPEWEVQSLVSARFIHIGRIKHTEANPESVLTCSPSGELQGQRSGETIKSMKQAEYYEVNLRGQRGNSLDLHHKT
jgi:hypothetical protein